MANATSITVTDLTLNAMTADPTGDALDTGTAAVTISADTGGIGNRVIFRVQNTAVQNLNVSILAGDNPPALSAGLGALASGNIAQNAIKWFGPFESGRFGQNNGKIDVTFTPGGTVAANVRCFRLPKA